nr:unnamed protein product [Callosobruchus analis]
MLDNQKKVWVRKWIDRRSIHGTSYQLFKELAAEDTTEYYFALTKAISTKERLAICLRGKSYKTYKGQSIIEKSYRKEQVSCKCKLGCKDIAHERRRFLFEKFYGQDAKTQSTFLLGLITVCDVQKRRHGSYENPQNSRRQAIVCYSIPDGQGKHVWVCKKLFQDIFAINEKMLRVLIGKEKLGESCYEDKRTRHAPPTFSEFDRSLVKAHINMIPREVDPCISKIFPNCLSIGHALIRAVRVIRLDCQVKTNIESSQSAKIQLELHHRKAERAREKLKIDTVESQDPESTKR